jgi:hypothetical protein
MKTTGEISKKDDSLHAMWPLAFGCGKCSGQKAVLFGCQTILVKNTGGAPAVKRTSGPDLNRRLRQVGLYEVSLQTLNGMHRLNLPSR